MFKTPFTHAVQEEVLLSLVRNSMDAIVSADGVIDYWNPAAERLYGYTAAEAIGKPATLIVPPEKLDEFNQMKEKLERGERIEQFATQRLRKDGKRVDVEITVFPVMDATGKLAATSVISHDMTTQRRLQKEVDETAAYKAEFLAKMSHEIRTPLNAIIGTAELQMLSEMTAEQRHRAQIIESNGELLLRIVDDILDFSKLSAGKLALEDREFNLSDLISGVAASFDLIARSKGLALVADLDPLVPAVLRGDSVRLKQILYNLVSNAIKFTAKGKVCLRVEKITESADDATIHFAMKDTGIGIALDAMGKLFQPFAQAERSTSREYGGTGLGLVIAAQLVDQMAGILECESELGKGSVFHFTLLLKKFSCIPQSSAADSQTPPSGSPLNGDAGTDEARQKAYGKNLRILVVEDNLTNQSLIRDQFAALGYSVRIVDNAIQALKLLGEERFDITFMDCELPGMNGYEATVEIRRREGNGKSMTIIAFTAHASEDERKRCLDSGMTDYVSKPVKLAELTRIINAYPATSAISVSEKPSESTQDELDPTALMELLELSKLTHQNVFRKLASSFLSDLFKSVGMITTVMESNDSEMIELIPIVHTLKSSSMIVGARRFSALCAEVEKHASGGDVNVARSLVGELLAIAVTLPKAFLGSAEYSERIYL
jgi:two-component system, sensor histidine kinase and response regulator